MNTENHNEYEITEGAIVSALKIEKLENSVAKAAWEAYKEAVGGRSINGDPLPDWETLAADPSPARQKIVAGWKSAGEAAVTAFFKEA